MPAKDGPCFKREAAVPAGEPLSQLHPQQRAVSRAVRAAYRQDQPLHLNHLLAEVTGNILWFMSF